MPDPPDTCGRKPNPEMNHTQAALEPFEEGLILDTSAFESVVFTMA